MTDPQFESWKVFHREMFAFSREEDELMFACWREAFADQRFTLAELRSATKHLAQNPPKWRDGHLREIQNFIRQNRSESRRIAYTEALDRSKEEECPDCNLSGWVEVPHLKRIKGDRWDSAFAVLVTAVVVCECSRGRQIYQDFCERAEGNNRAKIPLRLSSYTVENPNWDQQLKYKQEYDRRRIAAHKATAQADGTYRPLNFDQLLRRLKHHHDTTNS